MKCLSKWFMKIILSSQGYCLLYKLFSQARPDEQSTDRCRWKCLFVLAFGYVKSLFLVFMAFDIKKTTQSPISL